MMSYEEFTQKEAALESAPRAEREAFYAEILEKETAKTDVRMMAYFHAALLHYREGDFRAAREILEPFVIDYQSYAYRPEIIACFNLMGVAVYCERSYALARFYIHEGLKIARENHEISRYSYEYNNLAVTYLAQHEYEKALEAIREAERHLPDSDRKMHAYVYRNLSEICCHLDRLDEAQAALTRCAEEYDGRTLLPDDILLVEMLLYYKLGDAERYEKCRAEVWQKLPAMHAAEFGNTANNLFEAFTQGDNAARSQYGGTGLGMSIVAQLVKKMNGTIQVESTVGEGSSFTVVLPFAIDHDPPAAAEKTPPAGDLRGKRLLVVEDNELNCEIATVMLEELGLTVDSVEDGADAVMRMEQADAGRYDLIFMDIQMPRMDGYMATREIRTLTDSRKANIPIIAMTANAFEEDKQKALAAGMNGHMSKPIEADKIEAMLERIFPA